MYLSPYKGRPVLNRILWVNPNPLNSFRASKTIQPFNPNINVEISYTFNLKIQAMKEYIGEMKSPPHPRSFEVIEAQARKRGSEAGVKYAEAFMLIREII